MFVNVILLIAILSAVFAVKLPKVPALSQEAIATFEKANLRGNSLSTEAAAPNLDGYLSLIASRSSDCLGSPNIAMTMKLNACTPSEPGVWTHSTASYAYEGQLFRIRTKYFSDPNCMTQTDSETSMYPVSCMDVPDSLFAYGVHSTSYPTLPVLPGLYVRQFATNTCENSFGVTFIRNRACMKDEGGSTRFLCEGNKHEVLSYTSNNCTGPVVNAEAHMISPGCEESTPYFNTFQCVSK